MRIASLPLSVFLKSGTHACFELFRPSVLSELVCSARRNIMKHCRRNTEPDQAGLLQSFFFFFKNWFTLVYVGEWLTSTGSAYWIWTFVIVLTTKILVKHAPCLLSTYTVWLPIEDVDVYGLKLCWRWWKATQRKPKHNEQGVECWLV